MSGFFFEIEIPINEYNFKEYDEIKLFITHDVVVSQLFFKTRNKEGAISRGQ